MSVVSLPPIFVWLKVRSPAHRYFVALILQVLLLTLLKGRHVWASGTSEYLTLTDRRNPLLILTVQNILPETELSNYLLFIH